MNRGAIAIVWLVACGSDGAPSTVPPRAATTPVEPAVRIETSQIIKSSIADVWTAPEPPAPRSAPPPPPRPLTTAERDELDPRIAVPVPRARMPGRRAPCFANRDVLVGYEVWRDLIDHAIRMDNENPPPGRYGTCTIRDGELRDARGTLVAELHCGIVVHARGIIDHLGFEVGARPDDIVAAQPDLHPVCREYDDKQSRCWFSTDGGSDEETTYIVDGVFARPAERGTAQRNAAHAFFTNATAVRSFMLRIQCH